MSHESLDQTACPVSIHSWPVAQVHMAKHLSAIAHSGRSCSVQAARCYRDVERWQMVCSDAANTVLEQGYGLNQPAVEHTYGCGCGQKSGLLPTLVASTRQVHCNTAMQFAAVYSAS